VSQVSLETRGKKKALNQQREVVREKTCVIEKRMKSCVASGGVRSAIRDARSLFQASLPVAQEGSPEDINVSGYSRAGEGEPVEI